MLIGRILGTLEIRTPLMGAEHVRWVQLTCSEGICEAADLVGAQPGELVLVCRGEAASRAVAACPADAAVVGILSEGEKEVDKTAQKRL